MGFNSGFKGLKWKRRGYKAYLFLLSHTTMHGSMNVKLVLCIIRYGVWCFWCNVWKVHLLREKSGLKWKNVGTKLTYFWHSAWYPDVLCTTHHHKHQRLDPLILSVSRVTTPLANVSSVFQLFSFLTPSLVIPGQCNFSCSREERMKVSSRRLKTETFG